MRARNLLAALSLMSLATLACGLVGGNVGAPPAAAAPTPSAEPPSIEEPELEAVSLLEAVTAGVEPGSAGEAQGVITGLRYLTGELNPSEAFPEAVLLNGEGTGLIRLAQARLAAGTLPEMERAEIERRLAILLPSRATLEAISRPAVAAMAFSRLAAPAPQPLQDPCRDLWASGFSLPFTECLQYREFSDRGRTYRIYYPSNWPADAEPRALLDAAYQAMQDSIAIYNSYGPAPVQSTDLVFVELDALAHDRAGAVATDPDTGRPLRDPSVYAAADTEGPDGRCYIGVFPAAVDLALGEGEGAFRQTIAHELFHCYQYTNLSAQESGPSRAATEWWVEGSAEFFGAIVYPAVNAEFQYLPGFKHRAASRSLLTYSYHAYPFFQYLALQAGLGPEGVVGLLGSLPDSGGQDEQQAWLASRAGAQEVFHEFGQAFLDRQLQDAGGGSLPVGPEDGPLATFEIGADEGFLSSIGAFRLTHYRLRFADEARFDIAQDLEGEGKLSARPASSPGSWGRIPAELNTNCAEREYLVLVTGAVPPRSDTLTAALTTFGEEVEAEVGCEECLVGTWVLQNETALGLLDSLAGVAGLGMGVDARPVSVSGEMTLTFKTDGMAVGEQSEWTISGQATQGEDVLETRGTYNGTGQASWTSNTDAATRQNYVTFGEGAFDLAMHGVLIGRGIVIAEIPTIAMDESNASIFLSGAQPYQCTSTTLTYLSGDLPPVIFTRASGAP